MTKTDTLNILSHTSSLLGLHSRSLLTFPHMVSFDAHRGDSRRLSGPDFVVR